MQRQFSSEKKSMAIEHALKKRPSTEVVAKRKIVILKNELLGRNRTCVICDVMRNQS